MQILEYSFHKPEEFWVVYCHWYSPLQVLEFVVDLFGDPLKQKISRLIY